MPLRFEYFQLQTIECRYCFQYISFNVSSESLQVVVNQNTIVFFHLTFVFVSIVSKSLILLYCVPGLL